MDLDGMTNEAAEADTHPERPTAPESPAVQGRTSRGQDGLQSGPLRPRLIVLGAFALALVLFGLVVLAALRRTTNGASASAQTSAGAQTFSTPPTAAVRRIHRALHDMGARCKPGVGVAAQRQIGHDVDRLIAFARRYPDARFVVDDENGRSLDLLLIARDEMRTCAPAAAARANLALPAQLRTPPRTPTTP